MEKLYKVNVTLTEDGWNISIQESDSFICNPDKDGLNCVAIYGGHKDRFHSDMLDRYMTGGLEFDNPFISVMTSHRDSVEDYIEFMKVMIEDSVREKYQRYQKLISKTGEKDTNKANMK